MKNALQQNYNINVQGGSKVTTYNVSFGYYDQESNFKGQDFGIMTRLLEYSQPSGRGRKKPSEGKKRWLCRVLDSS